MIIKNQSCKIINYFKRPELSGLSSKNTYFLIDFHNFDFY